MRTITFASYKFDPNKLLNKPECPELIMAEMVKEILLPCPDDVDVKEFANTTVVSRNGKKVKVSVWQFDLADLPDSGPFRGLLILGSEAILAWVVQFFDNGKLISDIEVNASQVCALGYRLAEEKEALRMCRTRAMQWARQFDDSIEEFLSDPDSLAQAIADHMPNNAEVSVTDLTMRAEFKLKEHYVNVSYSRGVLRAEIEHKYTETEHMYGDRFSNYTLSVEFNSVDEINNYDWNALWDKLYENSHGTLTYHGSLGS